MYRLERIDWAPGAAPEIGAEGVFGRILCDREAGLQERVAAYRVRIETLATTEGTLSDARILTTFGGESAGIHTELLTARERVASALDADDRLANYFDDSPLLASQPSKRVELTIYNALAEREGWDRPAVSEGPVFGELCEVLDQFELTEALAIYAAYVDWHVWRRIGSIFRQASPYNFRGWMEEQIQLASTDTAQQALRCMADGLVCASLRKEGGAQAGRSLIKGLASSEAAKQLLFRCLERIQDEQGRSVDGQAAPDCARRLPWLYVVTTEEGK